MYILSDVLYVVLYHVTGYRKKVVSENLKRAFPNKSEAWRRSTQKKFFRHLCDIILESLKMRHMSLKDYKKRCVFSNAEEIEKAYNNGKDVILVAGHTNNWEYFSGISTITKYKCLTLYMPMKNKYFDRFFIRSRSHFGLRPIPMTKIYQELVKYKKQGVRVMTGFGGDQIPSNVQGKLWFDFLGIPTAVYTGAERISRKNNDSVFYTKMVKIRRGYYNIEFIPMFEHAAETKDNEITQRYFQLLEKHILEEPAHWLWSHRRWKRAMPEGTVVMPLNEHEEK